MDKVYTREDLANHSREELIDMIMQLQYDLAKGYNIIEYYNRTESNSKWSEIKPEYVAELHLAGWSLTEIKDKINKDLRDRNKVDKNGKPLEITIQTLKYKLNKYEQATGQKVYRVGTKGRKKKNPTVFD